MLDPQDAEAALLVRISQMYAELESIRERQKRDDAASREGHALSSAIPGSNPLGDRRRLILASRQLPYKLAMTESGRWRAEVTAMDQALENFKVVHDRFDCVWVGWPGTDVEPGHQMALRDMLREHRMIPVFLDRDKEDKFYGGFCKTILWPLFHSSMPTTEDTIARSREDADDAAASSGFGGGGGSGGPDERHGEQLLWQAYRAVNQTFADAIQDLYRDGDLIWVHDYHLLMLPQMLRALLPGAKIAFFLHLPFPSSEIYRILPFRTGVLEGILSADLVGFQTYDYARHFLSTVESLLDAECSPKCVVYNGHVANVAICPVGIDPDTFTNMARSPEVRVLMERWSKRFSGKTVLLGVDTIDATKGLVHKFLAIEEMLSREASLAQSVVFVQVCFRGSGNRELYTLLESQLHGIVERINSKLASVAEAGPVQFFQGVNLRELCALYCLADVLLVTPIRDGMNIVPFEYVVSREAQGCLASVVLSEFAGCARSLGGAVLVNPWDTNDVAEKMLWAVRMDRDERTIRHDNMLSYVRNFTSTSWCERMVEQLEDANEGSLRTAARLLHNAHVVQAFNHCRWRLVVLNLEGILGRPCSLPELVDLEPEVVESLRLLAREPTNMVVVKSPRGKQVLHALLGDTNCVLAAEHGAFIRWGRHANWQAIAPGVDMSWRAEVEHVLQYYTERTPGAVIEEREASLAWHYRDCDLGHGAWQAKQLRMALQEVSRPLHVTVYAGDKVLEVLPQAINSQVQCFLEIVVRKMRQLLKVRGRTVSVYGHEDLVSSLDRTEPSGNGGGGGVFVSGFRSGAADSIASRLGRRSRADGTGHQPDSAYSSSPDDGWRIRVPAGASLLNDGYGFGGGNNGHGDGGNGGGGNSSYGNGSIGNGAGSGDGERQFAGTSDDGGRSGGGRPRFQKVVTGVDLGDDFSDRIGDRVVILDTPLEQPNKPRRSRANTAEGTPPRGSRAPSVSAPASGGGGWRQRASSDDFPARLSATKSSKAPTEDGIGGPSTGYAASGAGGGFGGFGGSFSGGGAAATGEDGMGEGIFGLGAMGLPHLRRPSALAPPEWADDASDDDSSAGNGASTDAEDDRSEEADVDFVLVVAGGQDLNDEDMFEAMAPPPEYGLEEFLEQVEVIQGDGGDNGEEADGATPNDLAALPLRRRATIGPGAGYGGSASSATTAAAVARQSPYEAGLQQSSWEFDRAPPSPKLTMASRNMGVNMREPQTITPLMQRVSPPGIMQQRVSPRGGMPSSARKPAPAPAVPRSASGRAFFDVLPSGTIAPELLGASGDERSGTSSRAVSASSGSHGHGGRAAPDAAERAFPARPDSLGASGSGTARGVSGGTGGASDGSSGAGGGGGGVAGGARGGSSSGGGMRDVRGGAACGGGGSNGAVRSGPLAMVSTSTRRRQDISAHSKFAPRKDYPPASMLFLAMRRKYGEAFGRHELPDTPAECWALVLSTQDGYRGSWRPPPLDLHQDSGGPEPQGTRTGIRRHSATTSVPLQEGAAGGDYPRRAAPAAGSAAALVAGRSSHRSDVPVRVGDASSGGGGTHDGGGGGGPGRSGPGGDGGADASARRGLLTSGATAAAGALQNGKGGGTADGGFRRSTVDLLEAPVRLPSLPSSVSVSRASSTSAIGTAQAQVSAAETHVGAVAAESPPVLRPQRSGSMRAMAGLHATSSFAGDASAVEGRSRTTSVLDQRGLELPINSFACTVGLKLSQASYYIKSRQAVAALIHELAHSRGSGDADDDEDAERFDDDMVHVPFAIAQPHMSHLHSVSDTGLDQLAVVPAANSAISSVHAPAPGLPIGAAATAAQQQQIMRTSGGGFVSRAEGGNSARGVSVATSGNGYSRGGGRTAGGYVNRDSVGERDASPHMRRFSHSDGALDSIGGRPPLPRR